MSGDVETETKGARARRRSFTEALKDKYCTRENWDTRDLFVKIVVTGKPKNNGNAELGFLTNVVLNGCSVSHAGLPHNGLKTLCPNVVDLDLSSNLISGWDEILPIMAELPHLQFVNLSKNKLKNNQFLKDWTKPLRSVQNLVLNNTSISWADAVHVAGIMTNLQEIHICKNGYSKVEVENLEKLHSVRCLRLNDNRFTRWHEIWKLRYLPNLTTLVLSGNPLLDIYYTTDNPESSCTCENPRTENQEENLGLAAHARLTESFERGWNFPSPKNSPRKRNESGTSDLGDEICDVIEENDVEDDVIECGSYVDDVMRKVIGELIQDGGRDNDFNSNDIDARRQTVENYQIAQSRDGSLSQSQEPLQPDQSDSAVSMTYLNDSISLDESSESDTKCPQCSKMTKMCGFGSLQTLCVSDTLLSNWTDLAALDKFPNLVGIRMKDISLMSHIGMEDRRKLFVACLSRVTSLNGSEVTESERDKAERHMVRYFSDKPRKPERYQHLERKHGEVKPLLELDLSFGYQENVRVLLVYKGIPLCTDCLSVRDDVGKLRRNLADKIRRPTRCVKMYHRALSEPVPLKQELLLDNLPLSRYELRDGDEIHIDDSE